MKKILYLLIISLSISCAPQEEDKIELPAPPTAAFTYKAGKDANHLVFTNTTDGAFLSQWDFGNGIKSTEATSEAYFPYKGDYEVTLVAFNKGGHGSTKQTIKITQDDPNACFGNVALLTNCSEKVWKLKQGASALVVGTPGLTQVYWSNSDADFAARACHFNDEVKFTSKGIFEYDNKGDFWADADNNGVLIPAGGGIPLGCNTGNWKAPYDVWGSSKHKFVVNGDQLTLNGNGAWMGLYKVGTTAEVSTPQSSVTYKIIELTNTKLVIAAVYSSLEWRFTYEAK